MKEKTEFIFVAEDLGGLNSIEPVFKKLGGQIFQAKDKDLSDSEIENLVKDADIIIAGTSMSQNSLDKRFIRAAKKLGVKNVAILDFWTNYDIRFKSAMPDYIFVMDAIAKADLILKNYIEKKIIITGNPSFDAFKYIPQKGDSITFFCQPFTELENNFGLNEIDIVKDFINAFKNLGIHKKIKIKLHPRTKNTNKFEHLDVEITNEAVTKLIADSELIIGMNSMALFEAAMAGRKVLSYQPGLSVPDPLVTNRLKISEAVYKKEELENAIKRILAKQDVVNNYKKVENATDNVIETLKTIL